MTGLQSQVESSTSLYGIECLGVRFGIISCLSELSSDHVLILVEFFGIWGGLHHLNDSYNNWLFLMGMINPMELTLAS